MSHLLMVLQLNSNYIHGNVRRSGTMSLCGINMPLTLSLLLIQILITLQPLAIVKVTCSRSSEDYEVFSLHTKVFLVSPSGDRSLLNVQRTNHQNTIYFNRLFHRLLPWLVACQICNNFHIELSSVIFWSVAKLVSNNTSHVVSPVTLENMLYVFRFMCLLNYFKCELLQRAWVMYTEVSVVVSYR